MNISIKFMYINQKADLLPLEQTANHIIGNIS